VDESATGSVNFLLEYRVVFLAVAAGVSRALNQ
jgi:hypothetical protein